MELYNVIFDTYFTTFTCNAWLRVLDEGHGKEIIINSFSYLSQQQLVHIFGFVIMPNHVHVLWGVKEENVKRVRHSFTSFTGHEIVKGIDKHNPDYLKWIRSTQGDRNLQVWQRRPYWKSVGYEKVFLQKLNYIHWNPLRKGWKLAETPEDYYWSSARSYKVMKAEFDFLKLWGMG